MDRDGFAIRCPSCREWSEYKENPKDVVVNSVDEFESIMDKLQEANQKEKIFEDRRLFRCKNPRLVCPAPFEAVIHKGENQEFENLKILESWSLPRHFTLYKRDQLNRWDNKEEERYCGIIFNTRPVQRLRYIELESLMDREQVSRMIAGMCVEIDTPLTIFAASVFESEDANESPKVCWVPIEGYSQDEKKLVPPRYNLFCKTCRDISMKKLIDEFNEKKDLKYNIGECKLYFVKNEKCGKREAVCKQAIIDWERCPAFAERREVGCPCYSSDMKLIGKVEIKWDEWRGVKDKRREETMPKKEVRHDCYVGFHEVAFPIEVHSHLVGVAITGQLFFDPKEIKKASEFINSKLGEATKSSWDTLRGEEEPLEEARQILIGLELNNRKKDPKTAVFLTDETQMRKKIERLLPNLKRLEKSAESHYRDFRVKSEFAFRQELLWFIENNRTQQDFFDKKISYVLKRMQKFWAFKGAYLFKYSPESKKIATIAASILGEEKAFKFPLKNGYKSATKWQESHPFPYLHFRGETPNSCSPLFNEAIPRIERIIDEINDKKLKIANSDCEFVVVVPTIRGVYTFVFAIRDEHEVSSFEPLHSGSISTLCQDMIFETCNEFIGEFHNAQKFVEIDKQVQIDCLENLNREIENEMATSGLLLDDTLEDILKDNPDLSKVKSGISEILSVPKKCISQELTKLKSSEQP